MSAAIRRHWLRIHDMWILNEETQAFQALSYGDKLRVGRCLTWGQAPGDPRLAAAAVELGESYQDQSRTYAAVMGWSPVFMALGLGWLSGSHAVEGDGTMLILFVAVVLGSTWIFIFDPATRPKNIARCLDASRRVVAERAAA
jgi:hypothetical protein